MAIEGQEESGIEELMRLSREIGDMEKRLAQDLAQADEKIQLSEKKLALWDLINDIKLSLIEDRLKLVAPEPVLREFESLKKEGNARGLRHLIVDVVAELEKTSVNSGSDGSTERIVKTLSLLLDYLFCIE